MAVCPTPPITRRGLYGLQRHSVREAQQRSIIKWKWYVQGDAQIWPGDTGKLSEQLAQPPMCLTAPPPAHSHDHMGVLHDHDQLKKEGGRRLAF